MATQDRPDEPHRARRPDREASVVGSLSDMGVADLVQTLEMGKKSGVLHLHARTGARGTCWLRGGRVVDCELTGAPAGEEAFYRILRWREGGFAIEFGPVEREERIELPTQALLLQGMRRIDEWARVLEQLPPLDRRLEVDVGRLGERLARMPDDVNALLRLFDDRRTLAQVLEAAPRDDVATADAVSRLVADGVLREVAPAAETQQVETAAAAALPLASPPPELGGVDWFAGPVGPAAVTPASWGAATAEAASAPGGRGWLEPPLEPVAPAPASAPVTPPRPVFRFSIPVPPPGSLPPPPSVAETLARYQVVPRPRRAPEPEPQPLVAQATDVTARATAPVVASAPAPAPASPPSPSQAVAATQGSEARAEAAPAQPGQVVAAAASAVASVQSIAPLSEPSAQPVLSVPEQPGGRAEPAPVPEPRAAPAQRPLRAAEQPPPELVRRLSGAPAVRRRDPASIPVHLENERLAPAGAAPPRRSAVPYLALGAVVLAALVGGTALTRRTVVRAPVPAPSSREVETGPTQVAVKAPAAAPVQPAAAAADEAPTAPARAPAPSPSPERAPADAGAAAPAAPVPAVADDVPPLARPAAPAAESTRPAPVSPAPTAASAEPDPRKLLAAADRKYAAGRYADAIADYRRAIAQRSTAAARVSLARALYDAHRSAEALQELDGVVAESPRDASAWLLRGDIHQGEGRPAEAREAYQRFLELQPNGEQARTVRSILERDQQ